MSDIALPLCLGGSRAPDETEIQWEYTDPRFTHDWIEENCSDMFLDELFWLMCGDGWDRLKDLAEEIWGPASGVSIGSEGRSGGWAVVDGLPDVEDWDAVALAKWRKFAKLARTYADDVPYQMVTSVYMNEFTQWAEDRERHAPARKGGALAHA
jgi:hypothetical protein